MFFLLPDADSTFDQYKKYTIEKYHHVNIRCIHCLFLDQTSMIFESTRIVRKFIIYNYKLQ